MTDADLPDEIIGRYRDALDRGEEVDPEQIIRMHPELTGVLRQRFAALRLLERAFFSARQDPEPGPAPRIEPGRRLGPYLLQAEIGSGGMGTVYRARTVKPTEGVPEAVDVALKVVHPHLPAKRGFLERFHREVAAGRRVRHRNVVPTYDMGETLIDGAPTLYMTMAYVEGLTLRDLLLDLGRVPEALVREILRQTADGLAAIHDAGIVHRDLKPENVLVSEDHEVRITDLGVARLMEASQRLTSVGQFAGSVLYAAPEQFRGEPVDAATDLYSLGVVAYELLTGENPFRHEASMAVMRAHLETRPPPLTEAEAEISPFLAAVVATLLAKDPQRRFRSAAELSEVLGAGEASPWWAGRESAARRRERRIPRIPVRRETRVHGRRKAMQRLEHAWEEACQGRGNTLLVVGEAGIGKTRLLDAFVERLGEEEQHVLYGSYAPGYETGAVASAVLQHFGSTDLAGAIAPYMRETPDLVPAAVSTLMQRGSAGEPATLPIDAVQTVLANFARNLSKEHPVLWMVDDVDHASAEARRVLLAMARAVESHRVLFVLTATKELDPEMSSALARLPNTERIDLDRLSPRQVVELLQDALRSHVLAERLGVKIAFKSDGVPFFVFEMLRTLKDEHIIQQQPDGTFTQSQVVDEIEVPSVVRDLVRVRLADVSKDEHAILDVAAVEGYEFDADRVARVLERKRVAVLQDLADLERRLGLVRAAGRMFRFDHHQIRQVVYEDLAPALRAVYHGLLADAQRERMEGQATSGQDAAFLALHFLRGPSPAAAKPYLEPALRHLHATYRSEAALQITEAALAEEGLLVDGERIAVLADAAVSYELLGRREDERKALAEAVQLADTTDAALQRAVLRTRLGLLHTRHAAWDEARRAFDDALAIAQDTGERSAALQAESGRAGMLRALGRYDEAEAHFERARELALELGDRLGGLTAMSGLANLARLRGRLDQSLTLHAEALRTAEDLGDDRTTARTCTDYATALVRAGRFDEAQALEERAIEVSRRIGDRVGEAYGLGTLADLHSRRARFQEARSCQERALDIAREVGDRRAEAAALASLGLLHMQLDELDRARIQLEAYRALSIELSDRDGEAWAALRLGDAETRSDAPARAREWYEHALRLARDLGDRWTEALALGSLGEALLGLGRIEESQTRLREAGAVARELGDTQLEGAFEAVLGVLHRMVGARDAALEHARRSADRTASVGDRRGEAFAAYLQGCIAMQEGDTETAEERLELALEIASAAGSRRRAAWAALRLAELAEAAGKPLDARRLLREALNTGRSVGSGSLETLARCRLAARAGGDVELALRTIEERGAALPVLHRIEAHYVVSGLTDRRRHLEIAAHLVDELRAATPLALRASFDDVPLYRAIRTGLDACLEQEDV